MPVDGPDDRRRDLTPAHVRERADVVEVMFAESPRIFRLFRSHADFDRLSSALRASLAAGRAVRVTLTVPHGGDIADVQVL